MKIQLRIKPQKIITMMIFLMSICTKVYAQSPYAMFGDNSKMLEAKRESVPSIYRLGVQSTNGVSLYADFDMNKGIATLYDAEGNILRQDSISDNTKAMFTTMDPHAESYYHMPFLRNHRRSQQKEFGNTYQFYLWRSTR